MKLPWRDSGGPLPDTGSELLFDLVLLSSLGLLLVFTGVDAQIQYAVEDTKTYFSLNGDVPENAVVFNQESVDLMNTVSERSLGVDAVASERLYCGEVSNQRVVNFRFADDIDSSEIDMVSGSCTSPVDIFVHSQPDGLKVLSDEDRSLESPGISFTCIQFAEISSSPFNKELSGINCWNVLDNGEGFEQVPVFLE